MLVVALINIISNCSNRYLCRVYYIRNKGRGVINVVLLVCRRRCFLLRGKYGDMVPVTVHAQTRKDNKIGIGVEGQNGGVMKIKM